jgi:hypothetical protein
LKTKTIYVSVPWRDINSGIQSLQICKKILEMGHNPICWSIMYAQLLDFSDIKNREKALKHTITLIKACDEVWVFGSARTPFMMEELEKANYCSLPVIEYSFLDFLQSTR